MSILRFTEKGKQMSQLVFGSGQHRVKAAQLYATKIKKRIADLTSQIKKLQSAPQLEVKIKTLEAELAEERGKLEEITYWGLKCYDESKVFYISQILEN